MAKWSWLALPRDPAKKLMICHLDGGFLTSYFPYPWKDLSQYKLLILLTYQQFSGHLWLNYDQHFENMQQHPGSPTGQPGRCNCIISMLQESRLMDIRGSPPTCHSTFKAHAPKLILSMSLTETAPNVPPLSISSSSSSGCVSPSG